MKFIQGKPRNQWELYCLDEHVDADNEVRLIDLFVNSLNLAELGFKTQYEENGRPAYHPGALLRLFIYGYLNRIRSSRQLEKECKRNLELMWLMRELQPLPKIFKEKPIHDIVFDPLNSQLLFKEIKK
jgi:transposase